MQELGLPLLKGVTGSQQRPVIMAGAGVRLANIQKFLDIGLQEVQLSIQNQSRPPCATAKSAWRWAAVTAEADEFSHTCVDGDDRRGYERVLDLHSMVVH